MTFEHTGLPLVVEIPAMINTDDENAMVGSRLDGSRDEKDMEGVNGELSKDDILQQTTVTGGGSDSTSSVIGSSDLKDNKKRTKIHSLSDILEDREKAKILLAKVSFSSALPPIPIEQIDKDKRQE